MDRFEGCRLGDRYAGVQQGAMVLLDVDALVRLEEISVEEFEDSDENAVWQGHCLQLSEDHVLL